LEKKGKRAAGRGERERERERERRKREKKKRKKKREYTREKKSRRATLSSLVVRRSKCGQKDARHCRG
jgi:hypothetical protein